MYLYLAYKLIVIVAGLHQASWKQRWFLLFFYAQHLEINTNLNCSNSNSNAGNNSNVNNPYRNFTYWATHFVPQETSWSGCPLFSKSTNSILWATDYSHIPKLTQLNINQPPITSISRSDNAGNNLDHGLDDLELDMITLMNRLAMPFPLQLLSHKVY